jgi:hypothetical protein
MKDPITVALKGSSEKGEKEKSRGGTGEKRGRERRTGRSVEKRDGPHLVSSRSSSSVDRDLGLGGARAQHRTPPQPPRAPRARPGAGARILARRARPPVGGGEGREGPQPGPLAAPASWRSCAAASRSGRRGGGGPRPRGPRPCLPRRACPPPRQLPRQRPRMRRAR